MKFHSTLKNLEGCTRSSDTLRKERKQFLQINVVDTESEDANNILNFCIIFMRGSHNFTIVTMLVKYV